MCLLHHPDKQANAAAEVDEEVFKQIQKGSFFFFHVFPSLDFFSISVYPFSFFFLL